MDDIRDFCRGHTTVAAVQALKSHAVAWSVCRMVRFGLRPEQATAAVGALMPALAAGLKRDMATNGAGLETALTNGHHEKYIDRPQMLAEPATTADGNAILGHIFGSKDVSRKVAADAAEKSGVNPAVLKHILPLLASLAMGALARQKKGGAGASQSGGLTSMLEPLLDRDNDGSIIDDVGGMLGGLLNRKR